MLSKYACYVLLNSTQATENSWAQTKVGATAEVVWGCMLCNSAVWNSAVRRITTTCQCDQG